METGKTKDVTDVDDNAEKKSEPVGAFRGESAFLMMEQVYVIFFKVTGAFPVRIVWPREGSNVI